MIHKIGLIIETGFVLVGIILQPIFGTISAIIASAYFLAMLKMNIVDAKYGGSWWNFIKSVLKTKK